MIFHGPSILKSLKVSSIWNMMLKPLKVFDFTLSVNNSIVESPSVYALCNYVGPNSNI
jgi:hypothetical protein